MGEILRDDDRRDVPWRNGRGTTREILREPPTGEAFLWRVSLATIAEDGPFSLFPGCDRLLVLAEGAGFTLGSERGSALRVDPAQPVARFSGDLALECALVDGPARALNVITANGRALAELDLLDATARPSAGLLVCLRGSVEVAQHRLRPFDAIRLDGEAAAIDGVAALIRLRQT